MERMENYLEQNKTKLDISFSASNEISRIKETLRKHDWFKANGYSLTFPKTIDPDNTSIQDTEVESSVKEDFDVSVYEKKSDEIKKQWDELSGRFFEKVKSFNLLTQPEYHLYLTRYGVGGSYHLPNQIILNFNRPNYPQIEGVMRTVFHEIIHLMIEGWVREYSIDHWTKERLVDLTYNSIFDKKANLQRNPEQSEKVQEVFDAYFPDMKKVIMELSTNEK